MAAARWATRPSPERGEGDDDAAFLCRVLEYGPLLPNDLKREVVEESGDRCPRPRCRVLQAGGSVRGHPASDEDANRERELAAATR